MNFTHLLDKISKFENSKIVFVGLGNELRGDDASGIEFLEKLKTSNELKDSHFINVGTNPENYLDKILSFEPQLVVFIDSADMNCKPGEIKFIDDREIINHEFSTHSFSISLIKEFLLKQKSMEFLFIGIQPLNTSFRKGLSEEVINSIHHFFEI